MQLSSLYAFSSVYFGSSTFWHVRLGHLLDPVVKKFLGQSSLKTSFDEKYCNICLRVKQTQESFPLCLNKASGNFLFNSL